MTFVPVFSGGPVQPSNASLQAITLTENIELVWALEQQDGVNYPVANVMDITPDAAGLSITMPDASQTGKGTSTIFRNLGAETFTVLDQDGAQILTIASGTAWVLLVTDNTTAAGTWGTYQFGAGVSNANASALAGAGLKAISTTLNQAYAFEPKSDDYQIVVGDRAQVILWTGGVGEMTLPEAATAGSDWFTIVKNMGSGTLTVKTTGSEVIDDGASITVQVADSCFIATDGAEFYTIGFGQSVNSQFDYISIDVSGTGDYTLAGVQLNRIAYNLTGTLTGNRDIIVPATIQQYWVQNNTTGAFTLTVTTENGSGVTIPQGDSAIVFCDGTDVINAAESASVTFPISIGQGGTGQTTASAAVTALGAVPTTRTITAGAGLTGGGDLSANRALAVSLLGIETLTDPGADRLMFWDDSAGEVEWLAPGTGLSVSGTTLNTAIHTAGTGILNSSGTISVDRTGTDGAQVGYLDIPFNTQNGTYSLVITDRGKTIYHTSGSAHTYTVPTNTSVAFPVGTVVTVINANGGGDVTLAAAVGVTLRQAGSSNTGSRTLAANGVATLIKVDTNTWYISGVGMT